MFIEKFTDEQMLYFQMAGTTNGSYQKWFQSGDKVIGYVTAKHSVHNKGIVFEDEMYLMLISTGDDSFYLEASNRSYYLADSKLEDCIAGKRIVNTYMDGELIINP